MEASRLSGRLISFDAQENPRTCRDFCAYWQRRDPPDADAKVWTHDLKSETAAYSFQISDESFQSFPTFSQTTTYFPVTSCGEGALVLKLKVPISRAALGPSDLTSKVVSFGSPTLSAMRLNIAPMAAPPCTIAEPCGNAVASVV